MEQSLAKVDGILQKYAFNHTKLVPILQEIQAEYSYLPEDVMIYTAKALKIPASTIYGVATFYAHFTLAPKGKYIIKICDGTACHVRKSETIISAIQEALGLSSKKHTTDDGLFTLEIVACLGVCAMAPVVVVNDDVHAKMTPASALALIDAIRAEEAK